MSALNMWGTPRALINDDEFCPGCEHMVPGHYEGCPDVAELAQAQAQAIRGVTA
jgi:hypothetical protein